MTVQILHLLTNLADNVYYNQVIYIESISYRAHWLDAHYSGEAHFTEAPQPDVINDIWAKWILKKGPDSTILHESVRYRNKFLHCKNCHVYITQNFVWNFGQKILHFFCVTVTHFSLCVALENFCVLNAPILFHIRLLLCNINPQLHLLHITIIHKKQTCPMKIKLHNLHIVFNRVFCPLSIPWMLYPLFSTSSSRQT